MSMTAIISDPVLWTEIENEVAPFMRIEGHTASAEIIEKTEKFRVYRSLFHITKEVRIVWVELWVKGKMVHRSNFMEGPFLAAPGDGLDAKFIVWKKV